MKRRLKQWLLRWSPIALSANHRYDRLTHRILKKRCRKNWNCVDVGAHDGLYLHQFLERAPDGHHWAFEPLPALYDRLFGRYHSPRCTILPFALSAIDGEHDFNYVITNPAYSGLKKRPYDRPERDEVIRVQTRRMDSIIPSTIKIDFIKLDVEGGEWDVLQGATRVLEESRPLIVFEFGVAATASGITAGMCLDFLEGINYRVFLLKNFLQGKDPMNRDTFSKVVNIGKEYFFVAAPVESRLDNKDN